MVSVRYSRISSPTVSPVGQEDTLGLFPGCQHSNGHRAAWEGDLGTLEKCNFQSLWPLRVLWPVLLAVPV